MDGCEVLVYKQTPFRVNMGYKRGRKYAGFVARARFQSSGVKRRKITPKTKRSRMSRSKTSLNFHRFSRYTAASTEVIDGLELDKAYEYKFSDMVAFSEFANLFDRYKLDRVVTTFQLINNPDAYHYPGGTTLVTTATNFYPKMWFIHDYDDSTAESIGTLKERVGVKCRILQPNKTISVVTKPAVAIQTYKTATTTGYGPKWNQWIDMSASDVPHYGLKVAFDTNALDPVANQGFQVRVENKYYFSCKDVR